MPLKGMSEKAKKAGAGLGDYLTKGMYLKNKKGKGGAKFVKPKRKMVGKGT